MRGAKIRMVGNSRYRQDVGGKHACALQVRVQTDASILLGDTAVLSNVKGISYDPVIPH